MRWLREASTGEVKDLRREAHNLKEVVAEQALEIRQLKKSMLDYPRFMWDDSVCE